MTILMEYNTATPPELDFVDFVTASLPSDPLMLFSVAGGNVTAVTILDPRFRDIKFELTGTPVSVANFSTAFPNAKRTGTISQP